MGKKAKKQKIKKEKKKKKVKNVPVAKEIIEENEDKKLDKENLTFTLDESAHAGIDRDEFAYDLDIENEADNVIKKGFKNLISIIEPNQNDIEYTRGVLSADSTSSESYTDDSD